MVIINRKARRQHVLLTQEPCMLIFMVRHTKTYSIHYQSDHLINTTWGYKKESHCAVGNVLTEQTILSERYETSERDGEEKGRWWEKPRIKSGAICGNREDPLHLLWFLCDQGEPECFSEPIHLEKKAQQQHQARRDLNRQPPAPSRITATYSRLYADGSWKFPGVELAHIFWDIASRAVLLLEKFLYTCIMNVSCFCPLPVLMSCMVVMIFNLSSWKPLHRQCKAAMCSPQSHSFPMLNKARVLILQPQPSRWPPLNWLQSVKDCLAWWKTCMVCFNAALNHVGESCHVI